MVEVVRKKIALNLLLGSKIKMVEVVRKKIALNLLLLLTNFCASTTFGS
jgi:hypothetical protein